MGLTKCWLSLAIRALIVSFLLLVVVACATEPTKPEYTTLKNVSSLPKPDSQIEIASLSSCTHSSDATLRLNSKQPVNILVHGCFSSAGRFRALADVFAFHGQQTVCFSYDDRDRLEESSAELIVAINALAKALPGSEINIVGHSQGGLISRRSLTSSRADGLLASPEKISLVTISAPFAGIEASSHCGSWPLAIATLGITKIICQIVTGSKQVEIPPNSRFIQQPGELVSSVKRHLRLITDESNSCREYSMSGECKQDDYVFSLEEQLNERVDSDRRLLPVEVKAGHVEIVGTDSTEPTKLVAVLQQYGVIRPTPKKRKSEFALLMRKLY